METFKDWLSKVYGARINEMIEENNEKEKLLKEAFDKKVEDTVYDIRNELLERSKKGGKEYKWYYDEPKLVSAVKTEMKKLGLFFESDHWDIEPAFVDGYKITKGLYPYCLIHWDEENYNKKLDVLNKKKNKAHTVMTANTIPIVLIIIAAVFFSPIMLFSLIIPLVVIIATTCTYSDYSNQIEKLKKTAPKKT